MKECLVVGGSGMRRGYCLCCILKVNEEGGGVPEKVVDEDLYGKVDQGWKGALVAR